MTAVTPNFFISTLITCRSVSPMFFSACDVFCNKHQALLFYVQYACGHVLQSIIV